jgi:glycosyltransferase involved in cell wall biosynthesis
MISHSGIGVLLRQLLRHWAVQPPAFKIKLLGNTKEMARLLPSQLDAEYLPFEAPLYGVQNLLAANPYKKADLFFSPHYSVPLFALRMKNVIMIQDLIHITYPPKLGSNLYMRFMLQLLRRFSTLTVTPSRHTKVQLQTLHGFTAHRVLTHPLGPGLEQLVSETPRPVPIVGLPATYWLVVGIDKPHKNFDAVLNAYAALLKTKQQIPELVFAGIRPEGRSRMARRITELRLTEKAHILEPQPDKSFPTVYAKAQALIFPSLDEGFGFPVVEAMNQGIPVVCPNLSPMNEIAGKAGIYFDPDLPENLVERLSSLAANRIELDPFLAEGRKQGATFRWELFNAQLLETFNRSLYEF